jgi:tetratricopeptide (TPR) repeat protein
MGRYAEAAAYWRRAAELDIPDAAAAMVELAKLAEHQHRDPESALRWAERALAASEDTTDRWQRQRLATDLEHRRERLLRKLSSFAAESGASSEPPSS